MLLRTPACGSTVAAGAVDASSFTLAFDGLAGCLKIGVNAACDPEKGGQCCVGASAPKPPKFSHLVIKPSTGATLTSK